jgi:hypothetical protein
VSRRAMILGAVISLIALSALGCSLFGRLASRAADEATGGAVSTIAALQTEMSEAVTTMPAGLPTLPAPGSAEESPIVDLDSAISGHLSYPSEGIPPLRVVAFDIETQEAIASLETEANQAAYSLPVPPGAYYVVAYTLDGQLAGGYTAAVVCGLTVECTDHSLLPVMAAPGFAMDSIDPGDWYAPAGSFPPMP